jgi:hypothetical protein
MAFERTALKTYLGTLFCNDDSLSSSCVGGIHFRVVRTAKGVGAASYPAYVKPLLIWDLLAGVDDNTAGDRVLSGTILTAKIVVEQHATDDDLTNTTDALSRLATILDNLRDSQDGVRIRLISDGVIDYSEPISNGRFLDHLGRRYIAQLSTN